MKDFLRYIIYITANILLFSGCSSTKFVPENDYLLDKVEIITDNKDFKSSELKDYLQQRPNFKVFGLMKWQLYLYNWSGKNEKNWINKQLRRMGEAPVVLDTLLIEESEKELKRFLLNKGYMHAEVTHNVDTSKHKKATVTYHIKTGAPYRIRNYNMRLADTHLDSIAKIKPQKHSWLSTAFRPVTEDYNSLVKDSALFDRDVLDMERNRLTKIFREHGYYGFNKDYLTYLADSSFNQNVVDLEMYLKPFRKSDKNGKMVESKHKPYYLNKITILANYDPLQPKSYNESLLTDTITVDNIDIVYRKNQRFIRPSILARSVYLNPSQKYSEKEVEQTYSSFTRFSALKNTNLIFDDFEENDTLKLNCIIQTSPSKTQGFGIDIEGTNSAGDLGFASSLNYQHRNLFKGSENFTAKIRGAYESLGSHDNSIGNYWEIGAETGITFPRFLFPFVNKNVAKRLKATTEFKASYSFQTRPEYQRAILSGGWNYIWQDRNNTQARHIFKMIDINYVHLPKMDKAFADSLPESTRLYNFTDQFILGTGYTYAFSNYTPQNKFRNTHSLRFSFEMAGNLLYGISKLTKQGKNKDGMYELFGIPYSQFTKVDFDFSKSMAIDYKNKVAYHIGVGVGYPFGNTKKLPFERSYFSGGANSVRGWSVRSLGPGSMGLEYANTFADQIGDIRLDLNLEYRTKLFWKFELAAYIDAGNIWLFHSDPSHPNGNFDFSRFYKEIAVSYGLGIRLDFDFFLLRFDTGMKAYDPQQRGSDRWAIKNPNFRTHNGNFAWHFAVGYPF